MTPLGQLIRDRIAAAGPISVAEYMSWCLGHPQYGYYMRRDPFGRAGDFITAPEISQMFGELIGGWLAATWVQAGCPSRVVLAELGPGRGTLMADALRTAARQPGFMAAVDLWLIETSPALRARQAAALAAHEPRWADRVEALPAAPLLLVANEFFDALPVRQFQRLDALWRERRIGLEDNALTFVWAAPQADPILDAQFARVPDGAFVETNPLGQAIAAEIGTRIFRHGGAALIVDYGDAGGTGDTLQAVANHANTDPLAAPGTADLTAHVAFDSLASAASDAGATSFGPLPQGVFLERLGITLRARKLAAARPQDAASIAAAHRRLTHPDEMGNLFRVLALSERDDPPAGFDK